jgi:hypothetical protein
MDFIADPGLRAADRTPEGVRLPKDFVFTGGRAESDSAFAAISGWVPKDAGATGGR